MLERKGAHMFNMFIMKEDLFQAYCSWLFPILEELERQIDTSQMTPYEARYVGRISELLLDVWLDQNHVAYRKCHGCNWEGKIGRKRFVLSGGKVPKPKVWTKFLENIQIWYVVMLTIIKWLNNRGNKLWAAE